MSDDSTIIELGHLRSTLAATERLKRASDLRAARLEAAFLDVAKTLFPEQLDAARRASPAFDRQPVDSLIRWVNEQAQLERTRHAIEARASSVEIVNELQRTLQQVRAERDALQALAQDLQERVDALAGQLTTATDEKNRLKAVVETEREDKNRLSAQLAGLQREVTQARAVLRPATPKSGTDAGPVPMATDAPRDPNLEEGPPEIDTEDEPQWFKDWQASPAFTADKALIEVMGQTGYPIREQIERELLARGVINSIGHGTSARLWGRVRDEWQLTEDEAIAGVGKTAKRLLVRLSARGQEAYQRLSHSRPALSWVDQVRKTHRGDNHVALILETCVVFQQWNARRIDPVPGGIASVGGSTYFPDIWVEWIDGTVSYVECETGSGKNTLDRRGKWEKYRGVTDTFYIVCEDTKTQEAIGDEVARWCMATQQAVTLMHISIAKAKESDKPVWQRRLIHFRV